MLSWSSGSVMGLLCYQVVVALLWDCYVIRSSGSGTWDCYVIME